MSMHTSRRGSQLPYQTLAGVVPCPGGWLVAAAKLQGITMSPEAPQVFGRLLEVLDYKPAYQIISLAAPVGLLDEPTVGGRRCDRDARRLIGWPRSGAVVSAPARSVLRDFAAGLEVSLSAVSRRLVPRFAEVDENIQPYWQRTVYEVHPELSFFQLNEDQPLRYSKHKQFGVDERTALLKARLPGVERILDTRVRGAKPAHQVDGAVCLWTSRRIAARAVSRLPENPEWDSAGLRMEIVR
jgi:predicted RNase H-like nuclease